MQNRHRAHAVAWLEERAAPLGATDLPALWAREAMRTFSVPEPVFKTEPLFVLGCDHEAFARYIRRRFRHHVEPHDGQIGTMYTFDRDPRRVIWTLRVDLPVVLHEIFHLVTRICEDKGVPIRAHHEDGSCGDETAAYLYEHFARAALKRLRS